MGDMSRRLLRILVSYLLVALVASGLLLLNVWPWHPISWRAWLLFVVLAPPVLIAGDWIGGMMLTNPLSRSVDRATARNSFSWLRIAYVLALIVFVLGAASIVRHFWGG
jgi:hypothetical protein